MSEVVAVLCGSREASEPAVTSMKKLRRKLGDPAANPRYIFNRHGVGYSFGDPAAA